MKCCCLWTLYFSHHIINIHSNHFYKYLCTTRLLVYPVWRQNLNCTLPGTRFKGGRELWSRFFGGFSRLMHHMCDNIGDSELNPNDDMFPHPTSRIVTKMIKSLQKWENWKGDEMIVIMLRNKSGRTSAVWRQKLLLQLVGQRQTGGEQVIIDFVITVIIV